VDEARLARIETRQDEMIATLAVIRERVEATNGFVDDLRAEVGRVPLLAARGTRLSLTDRMHEVEGTVTPLSIEAAVHRALEHRLDARSEGDAVCLRRHRERDRSTQLPRTWRMMPLCRSTQCRQLRS
jgi:hypothetical protein